MVMLMQQCFFSWDGPTPQGSCYLVAPSTLVATSIVCDLSSKVIQCLLLRWHCNHCRQKLVAIGLEMGYCQSALEIFLCTFNFVANTEIIVWEKSQNAMYLC